MTDANGGIVKWTLSGGGVIVNVEAVWNSDGTVTISYNLDKDSAPADLNGMFFDFGNNGGKVTSVAGEKANNMNGSTTDGEKLDGFDKAVGLGSVGGNDADKTFGTVTLSAKDLLDGGIKSLADLANTQIGIRATSVGDDREGSVKLAALGTYCPPEADVDAYPANFPLSNATLIFKIDGDEGYNDKNNDGYFAVKVDDWDEGKIDFDQFQDTVLSNIASKLDIEVATLKADLLGVILKGGTGQTLFYAAGDTDPGADAFPKAPAGWSSSDADYWLDYPPKQGNVDGAVLDITYSVDDFVF